MSPVPELQPGESAVAYFQRLREAFKTWSDPTGVVSMTLAASIAALAVADRNEPIQRELLAEVKKLNAKLDKVLPPAV